MRVGCSLIGILIVIVILGVAAALTFSTLGGNPTTTTTGIAALTTTTTKNTTAVSSKEATAPTTAARGGGIPSQAAVAACQADASTVENAVVDYSAAHGIPATAVTVRAADLGTFAVPLLHPYKSRLQDLHHLRCGDGGGAPVRSSRSVPRGRSLLKGVTADDAMGPPLH